MKTNCVTAVEILDQHAGDTLQLPSLVQQTARGFTVREVRSKTDAAQKNEVLCKLIAYNLSCLVHAIYELGIVPEFWQDEDGEREIIWFPVRC